MTLDEVIRFLDNWQKRQTNSWNLLNDALRYLKSYQAEKYMWDEIEKFYPEIKELLEKWSENVG
jgi:hypothetical protein